ncbi:HNH endonuclease [Parasaccharibacter apium]|uniref:HNH endonuclease n=2 Tax=Parasaccharibacter apium TaxID=1510841 RepID=A0ABX4ZL58_9PROT|nr:HNH endonuclease [Parasaccharibacter apium]POS65705.1 HNH endonuclease [Parasaccharibacter apium]POS65975.1 HNH endonuclease [Parasaccharibacter apium]
MLDLCNNIQAKRARTVIKHILEYGFITTEELKEKYGYDHPPRAIRDVRENGVPLNTHKITSLKTNRRIAAYTFGDPSKIIRGRIGGRKAFPKKLKQDLIKRYGSRDAISNTLLPEAYLQIDHRIPYEISGDNDSPLNLASFMLLDSSSNRQKSWACEHCPNFLETRSIDFCKSCYWSSPEEYTHIAGSPFRRIDITWSEQEVDIYDRLFQQAKKAKLSLPDFIKKKLEK